MTPLFFASALILAAAAASQARAEVSSVDILRSLKPATAPLTRGIAAQPTRRIEVVAANAAEVLDNNKHLPRIDLAIEFEYDSDRPTPAGGRQLAQLAAAQIEPSRLTPAGFGKTRPLANVSPDDPRNRRVEVVNLLN